MTRARFYGYCDTCSKRVTDSYKREHQAREKANEHARNDHGGRSPSVRVEFDLTSEAGTP